MVTTVRATFDGKVLVPEGAVDLPVDTRLEVDVRSTAPAAAAEPRPALLTLLELTDQFPPNPEAVPSTPVSQRNGLQGLADRLAALNVGGDLPADYSAQHEHYLYGTPKRSDP